MPANTNLDANPYFDDYNANNNYYQILYKPSVALQARELTQTQTMLQKQIERYGNWAFKNGDIVSGCAVSDIPKFYYTRLADTTSNGTTYDINSLVGSVATDVSSNLSARVVLTYPGIISNYPDTQVMYLSYINTGTDGSTVFANNAQLNFTISGNVVATINTFSNVAANTFTSGIGRGVKVTDGIVYLSGYFVKVTNTVIGLVNAYSQYAGNNVVGFVVDEQIVTSDQDSSLLDNALGYPNYNAPGADRLKVSANLISLDPTIAANTPNFNPIALYNFGTLVQYQTPLNNIQSLIGDAVDQRTFEEAGNFVVNPFTIDSISSSPSVVADIDANHFLGRVSPGVGYVLGNRVENLKTSYVTMRRGVDTASSLDNIITMNYNGYVIVNQVSGIFPFSSAETVTIYDTPQNSITNRTFTNIPSSALLGNVIGTAKIRCFTYNSGNPGTSNARYFIHLFNVNLTGNNTTSSIKSFCYKNGSTVLGVADLDLSINNSLNGSPYQLFSTGTNGIVSLRDSANNNNVQYLYRKYANTNINTDGTISVTLTGSATGGTDELPFGPGVTLTSGQASTIIAVVEGTGTSAALNGTVTVYSTNNLVVGSSTNFTQIFAPGETILVGSDYRVVNTVNSDTSMTVDSAFPSGSSGATYYKRYLPGQVIPVTSNQYRSIVTTSNTNFIIRTNIGPTAAVPCSVFFDVQRTHVSPAKKTINKNRYVLINTTINPTGPWCLGFSDVHQITGIWGASTNTYSTSGANVMSSYVLDTGQRDDRYDLAYLYPTSNFNSYPYLTVQLDYFSTNTQTGVGFYTVESYPVDDSSTANTITTIKTIDLPLYVDSGGNKLPLRNMIDFRPVGINTATDTGYVDTTNAAAVTTAISAASYNPSSTLTLNIPSSGLNVPSYGGTFETDYTYYLPRKDLIYYTTTNILKVKEGASSLEPQTPLYPDNGMPLSVLSIPPYPSLTSDEINILTNKNSTAKTLIRDTSSVVLSNLVTNRRYTMADIAKLDNRIGDLEYYASLSLLQQQTTGMTVTDSNGLDRFKNGIFVDPFSDFTFSDVSSPEYSIAIDEIIGVARPRVNTVTIETAFNAGSSSNITLTGRLLTLSYTSVPFLSQPNASVYRTCAPDIWMWNGSLTLVPPYNTQSDYSNTGSVSITIDQSAAWQQFANTINSMLYGPTWRSGTTITQYTNNTVYTNSVSGYTGPTTGVLSGSGYNGGTVVVGTGPAYFTNTTQISLNGAPTNYYVMNNTNFGPKGTQAQSGNWVWTGRAQNGWVYVGNGSTTSTNTYVTSTTVNTTTIGRGLTVNTSTSTVQVGSFASDVSLNPYIAPQIISFYAYGMRPGQRLHAFFDSVNVDNYCAPGIYPSGSINTFDHNQIVKNGNWGDPLVADQYGHVAGQFNVPASTFKFGDRVLELADVASLTQGADAISTMSTATFTGGNLNVSKQGVTLTTVNPIVSTVPIKQTVVTVTNTTIVNTSTSIPYPPNYNGPSPIAQILTINTPNGEAGIYATSVNIYFYRKSQNPNHGVSVYILDTLAGNPNGNSEIPFSRKHILWSDVNTSSDASVPTTFTFDSPVYLQSNTQYALVVKGDSDDPDYQIWVAKLGDSDVKSGNPIYSVPTVGLLYIGPTFWQWSPVNDEYMKYDLSIANFSSGTGTAVLNNTDTEFLNIGSTLIYSNNSLGVIPGDVVYAATNGSVTTVNTSVNGPIKYYDYQNNLLYVTPSTGGFNSTSAPFIQIHRFTNTSVQTPNTSTLIAYTSLNSVTNPVVDAVVPQYAMIAPPGTSLSFSYSGTSNSYQLDSNFASVTIGTETELFDFERIVASKSNEITNMGGSKSLTNKIAFTTDSPLLSPVVDLTKSSDVVIQNLVDPISLDYNEYYGHGSSLSKYISQVVTLASGQDAQDLQITISAHRPPGTDIQVWARYLNREDTDPITAKTWGQLQNLSYNTYSSPTNPNDFQDITFATCPYYNPYQPQGNITVLVNNTTVTGYNTQFTQFTPGYYISSVGNSTVNEVAVQIVSIANDTSLTISQPFTATTNSTYCYANATYFMVPPPTTPWLGQVNSVQANGTVSTFTTNNAIVGVNTLFTNEYRPGSVISVNGDSQPVTSISNNTLLYVSSSWTSNNTGANSYNVQSAGISYLNNQNSLFTTFASFQIKIILQSNDSSKVPILDNLRALALQL